MSIAGFAPETHDSIVRRRAKLLAAWGAALLLFCLLQYGLEPRGSHVSILIIDTSWTAVALFAAYQSGLTAMKFEGRERYAWLALGAGSGAWFIGQVYWDYLELGLGKIVPFPAWCDIGYLSFPLLAVAGLLLLVRRADLRASYLRPLCNLGLIAVALYTCLAMLLHDVLAGPSESGFYVATAIAYPLLYGTAFLFALTTLSIYARQQRRFISMLLTGGLGCLAIAATDWGVRMIGRNYVAGESIELAWLAGFALLHWAAWERRIQPASEPAPPDQGQERLWLETALPMLALVAIFVAIATDGDGLQIAEIRGVLLPGGLVFAVLLAAAEWASRSAEAKLRRRAESALRALQVSEEKLASILEIAPEAIIAADLDGRIELFNRGAEQVFGYSAREVIGRPIELLLPQRLRPKALSDAKRLDGGSVADWEREFGAGQRRELTGLRKDGGEFPAEASVFRLATEEGFSFALILRDTADRKRQDRDLRHAKETAELANRAKSEFLANMSHELRTPLNAVIGFSQIIKDRMFGSDIDRYVDYANDINASGTDLLRLINDILDLSKIEAGQMNLREQAVDLEQVVASCLKLSDGKARQKGVTLERNLPAGLPRLWADELRLKQMLNNLVSNAVKFTESGGRVVISVRPVKNAGDEPVSINIVVRDTGIGMDPSEIPVALSPFGQVDQGLARRHEGTGLGLPLVRNMIELHGGTLSLASARGKGTTATLHLPAMRTMELTSAN
jgi:PAS domain S-box-containing protein